MMWVWQGSRLNSWLAGNLAEGWLMWCCCLVVGAGNWCWFCAVAWLWRLEADADLVLLIVAWNSRGCPGATGVSWFTDFANFHWFCWSPSLGESLDMEWIRLTAHLGQHANFAWLETVVCHYEMFKIWPVSQSSRQVQDEEEANMAASSKWAILHLNLLDLTNFNAISWILSQIQGKYVLK